MGAPEHASDAEVIEAVTALPGATTAEVAGALGIGRSTAAKHLARLEPTGAVSRRAGGRSGGARVADRWFPGPLDTATPRAEPTGGDPAPANDAEESPLSAANPTSEPRAPLVPPDAAPGVSPDVASGAGDRLAPGALGAMVRDYLAARPEQSFGPSGIAKALCRSPGAVSNALSALVARGEGVQVAEHPRRFRAAPSAGNHGAPEPPPSAD